MKRFLLIACAFLINSFGWTQELIKNGDFELPKDGKKYLTIDSIPNWKTDDHKTYSNVRDIYKGDGVCNQWDEAGSFYQVVGVVPSSKTTFAVNYKVCCTYSYWAGWKVPLYVIFSAYSGDDPTKRVAIDSVKVEFYTASANYGKDSTINEQYVLEAGNAHAGQHLVIEFKQKNSQDWPYGSSWTYLNYDDISVVATGGKVIIDDNPDPQGTELLKNGDFSLPADSVEHKNLNNIPEWKTDTQSNDFNGRSNVNEGPRKKEAVAWLWDETPGIYQVVGTVPSVATKYEVSFDLSCFYTWWGDYKSDFFVILSAFSGTDATTRVALDSIKFNYDCVQANWFKFANLTGSCTLAAGNAHAGENLVVEFKPFNSQEFNAGSSYTYFWLDNCSVKAKEVSAGGDNLIKNGDFSLPADSVEHKNLNNIPEWKTDTQSNDFNGRSNVNEGPRKKEAVAWLWDETPGIYQVVGTVPSVATKYEVSFDLSCFYTWWGDYKSDFFVILSAFSGTDATTRVALDSIKFNYDCVQANWFKFANLTGSCTLAAGNAHAGENLVVEFKPFNSQEFNAGSSYTYFWLDNVVLKSSIATPVNQTRLENDIKIIGYNHQIRILGAKQINSVSVFDLMGRKIFTVKPNSNVIEVAKLKGIYIIVVDTNAGRKAQKVIF
jgi:hypothetical protein